MEIPYYREGRQLPQYNGDKNHLIEIRDIEKGGDLVENEVYKSMERFINEDLDHSYEYYETLKELIYSKDRDNLIIAWTIIDKL